jgi:hypothetical protein
VEVPLEITIGQQTFRIVTTEEAERWTAHAIRVDTGDRFGVDASADSPERAAARLSEWLEWQAQHTDALAALQSAERDYHRSIADGAFAGAETQGPSSAEYLEAVKAACRTLDDIRVRRPIL